MNDQPIQVKRTVIGNTGGFNIQITDNISKALRETEDALRSFAKALRTVANQQVADQ